jgi:hypothetical protein
MDMSEAPPKTISYSRKASIYATKLGRARWGNTWIQFYGEKDTPCQFFIHPGGTISRSKGFFIIFRFCCGFIFYLPTIRKNALRVSLIFTSSPATAGTWPGRLSRMILAPVERKIKNIKNATEDP